MMPVEEAIEQARDWARDNQRKSVYAANALVYIDAIPQNRLMADRIGMSRVIADAAQYAYVLCNLGSWRGELARECKAVIKAHADMVKVEEARDPSRVAIKAAIERRRHERG